MIEKSNRRFVVGLVLVASGILSGCASSGPAAAARSFPETEVRRGQRGSRPGPKGSPGIPDPVVPAFDETVELPALLRAALARNPGIQEARGKWEAALERVPQATALPDPSVTVLEYLESVETRVGPTERAYTFMQKIPWPGKLIHAGDVAEEGARIAALQYSAVVRDVLVAAKTAFFEYAYLVRARGLVEQNIGLARRLAALGTEQYAEDKALLIDVLKAQSQLAQLDYDLITLTELISAEQTRINALVDLPPEQPLGAPVARGYRRVSSSVTDLYAVAAMSREEIRIADRRIEMARAKESLAKDRYAPDITLGATYVEVGDSEASPGPSDSGQDAYGISLGITIPLWVNRISAGVRQAQAERSAAIAARSRVWNETVTAVKDAYFKLTNAERLLLLYRDSLVPQAKQVMLSSEERSRENRLRLGDYLEARTVWLNFTLAMERALADHHQAIARIERLTGAALRPTSGGEFDR